MNPETLRGWLETCDLLGDDPIVPKDDVLAAADAWEATERARAGQASEVVRLKRMIEAAYAENVTLRQRLEQWEAEARDNANPQIRPMTAMENRYMDLEAEHGALKSDNDILRQRLEAAENVANTNAERVCEYFDQLQDALQRLEAAEKAIRQVLADEETGHWGPDVTMAAVLRDAVAAGESGK